MKTMKCYVVQTFIIQRKANKVMKGMNFPEQGSIATMKKRKTTDTLRCLCYTS
jgi:hypothetical protein